MELIYLWIEKLGIIQNQEFNFNSSYEIHFDNENKKLSVKKTNKDMPDNFFGENITNITGIIGKNGSGKSSLLKSIMDIKNDVYKKYIMIYKSEGKLSMKYCKKFKDENIDIKYDEKIISKEDNKFMGIIYYNPSFVEKNSFCYNNISSNDLFKNFLYNSDSFNFSGELVLEDYLNREYIKQIKLILEERFFIEKIPYRNFKDRLDKIDGYYYKLKDLNINYLNEEEKKKYKEHVNKINYSKCKDKSKDFFENNLIYSLWQFVCREIVMGYSSENKEDFKKYDIEIKKREDSELVKEWFEKTQEAIFDKLNNENSQNSLIFSEGFIKLVLLRVINNNKVDILNNESIRINEGKLAIELGKDSRVEGEILQPYFPVSFSNGERGVIEFLARLKDLNLDNNGNNFLLLIDEMENSYHPEWQRKLITFLIYTCETLKLMENKKIQIIFTSHSPFMISDLPSKNVILLGKYEEDDELVKENKQKIGNCKVISNDIKTFGSNIYDIFSKGMFMDSTFGEFSRNKIKEVIKLLSKNCALDSKIIYNLDSEIFLENEYKVKENIEKFKKKKLKEIEFIIENIGEPLIKNRLKSMLENYEKNKPKTSKEYKLKFFLQENDIKTEDLKEYLKKIKGETND